MNLNVVLNTYSEVINVMEDMELKAIRCYDKIKETYILYLRF